MLNNSSPARRSTSRSVAVARRWSLPRCRDVTCLAIELNPAYVDVAVERWQNFAGAAAVHEHTGRTFAEVAAGRAAGGEPIAPE